MDMNMIKIKDYNPPNHHHHHQDDIIHDHQSSKLQASPKLALAPPSPPSNASSPSHEFSFTISLHPNSAAATTTAVPDKSKPTHDFSPADEIFFQGHLLPLHLLSNHLTPISPRASTNSLDSLPLPVDHTKTNASTNSLDGADIKERTKSKSFSYGHPRRNLHESKDKPIKSKSFSFLGIPKWRTEKKQSNNQQNHKKKMKFDIGNVVKRYIRMIRPLILSLRGKKDKSQILRHPHSFSGNLGCGGGGGSRKGGVHGRRDFSSAPASMRTSPGNSGLLAPAPISSTSDSTMEELQAAIQAAIAHCKNSISMEERIKVK